MSERDHQVSPAVSGSPPVVYRGSLRRHLTLLIAALIIVPTLVSGLFLGLGARYYVRQETFRFVDSSADLARAAIEMELSNYVRTLSRYRTRVAVREYLEGLLAAPSPARAAELRRLAEQQLAPLVEKHIGIPGDAIALDLQGHPLAWSGVTADQAALAAKRYTPAYLATVHQSMLGDTYLDPVDSDPTLDILTPLDSLRPPYKAFAILVWRQSLKAAVAPLLVNTRALGRTGEWVLVDHSGLALLDLRHRPGSAMSFMVTTEPARRARLGLEGTFVAADYRGRMVVASARQIRPVQWGLVTKIDVEEAFAGLYRLSAIWGALMVLLVLAGLLLGRATARQITSPVFDISGAARAVAGGDVAARVDTHRNDELGQLAHDFNSMADRIANNQAELVRTVDERTAELRMANAYNRSLIEASLDPLVTISREGKVTDVNSATERVTGRARDELVGTDFSDYFTQPELARAGYEQVFREGRVTDYRLEIKHRDGHTTPVIYNATIYRDPAGHVSGVFAAARDITERVKAEAALEAASAYNRSLIEASLDPLVTISRDGKVTDVNSATERVTGCPRDQLIGTDFSDYFTDPEQARAGYEQVFREGQVTDYRLEIKHQEGHTTPVIYNATIYRDPAGEIAGVFAAARDITERIRQENEILALNVILERRAAELARINDDLRRMNAEMTSFTYSVSHDLASPLVSLQGLAGMLLRDYSDRLDDEGKRRLGRLQVNVQMMESLVSDLLELSRIGRIEGKPQRLELGNALAEVLSSLQESLEEKHIEVVTVGGEGCPAVQLDVNRLRQVLSNLIGNAIKYGATAAEPRIEITCAPEGDGLVQVTVRDNGPGIDPAHHARIFQAFTRLAGARDQTGTGMGLAIVKKIVEHYGGRIWVESEPGAGTAFHFTLPKAE